MGLHRLLGMEVGVSDRDSLDGFSQPDDIHEVIEGCAQAGG